MNINIYDKDEVRSEVARRLRRAREVASLTHPSFKKINEFASFIQGIEVPTYYHYEGARKLAPIFVIKQVAELTGEDPAYLYCLIDESRLNNDLNKDLEITYDEEDAKLISDSENDKVPSLKLSKRLLNKLNIRPAYVEYFTIENDIFVVDTDNKTVNKNGYFLVNHFGNLLVIYLLIRIDGIIEDSNGVELKESIDLKLLGRVIYRCLK